jgi:hypothetical protein
MHITVCALDITLASQATCIDPFHYLSSQLPSLLLWTLDNQTMYLSTRQWTPQMDLGFPPVLSLFFPARVPPFALSLPAAM